MTDRGDGGLGSGPYLSAQDSRELREEAAASLERRKNKGLHEKYHVERTDGKLIEWCFVLEIKDPLARLAMSVYAGQCLRVKKWQLASDLYDILARYEREHPDA